VSLEGLHAANHDLILAHVFLCRLLREPGDYLLALKQAVEELVGAIDPKFLGHGDIHVTLTGG